MPVKKKGSKRKYGKAAGKSVKRAVHKMKEGTLKSGRSGKTVKAGNRQLQSDFQKRGKKAQKFRNLQRERKKLHGISNR